MYWWVEWHDHYVEISAQHDANDVLEEYIRYFNLLCDKDGLRAEMGKA